MAKNIQKYTVFIASPGDLMDERAAVEDVIRELNLTYGNKNGLIIELLKWETHAAPGASISGTQDLIDSDIGNDYDLFIGVLWKKFGTATERYGSGTQQEFENAYERFKKNPHSLQILFYFNSSGTLSLNEIDPVQLSKVNIFKTSLQQAKVLYWEYGTIEAFQQFLRIHIPQRIDGLRTTVEPPIQSPEEITNSVDDEELGVLDYKEIIEETLAYGTQSILRIGEATQWIGKEISKKTVEHENLTKETNGLEVSNKVLRDFYGRIAKILNEFSDRVDPEIGIFSKHFEEAVSGISKQAILFQLTPNGTWDEQIMENAVSLEKLSADMITGITGMQSFLDAVSRLPRMEKEFNKARRRVEGSLGSVVNTLNVNLELCSELEKEMKSYL
ncbi:MAG: DUF4062 domain-containing protein [Pedobacter sp.]|nr:MAG: DUF4062 domain-containing protein [Pedobacter sp.]